VGIGGASDAADYGDEGANTLGHILERQPDLRLPVLESLGLGEIVAGIADPGGKKTSSEGRDQRSRLQPYRASYGKMRERSAGKDTTTGHWEIAGVILEEPFATFEHFPQDLVRAIEREAGVEFIGNYPQSGTTVLAELGTEHVDSGKPILYTSADSVLQIAAHEEIMPIDRLYDVCKVARRHADAFRIGRVIARPFTGSKGNFSRTSRRHDYSMAPPPTILDAIKANGESVIGVGKISDIFAGHGITESFPTESNAAGMRQIREHWDAGATGFIFANLVDFDMLHGHRRNVKGYAQALVEFDQWLGDFITKVKSSDLVIITADHGNDPTFRGTDHTREQVPLFVLHEESNRALGTRDTFADVAASLADYFSLPEPWAIGHSFLSKNRAENAARPSQEAAV
ncbi:MAG TPA: phosphopentomutase, partial [Chthoniobacterales bacterium]|nr:phosphopentomutase [Chthoniobacterales bacterium]